MDRKEKILSFMRSKEYVPLKMKEIAAVLCVPHEDEPELAKILEELCTEGSVYMTKKKRYMAVGEHSMTVSGRLKCSSRGFFGFVISEDENIGDVFVPGDMMSGALDADKVLVKINGENSRGGHHEGHIIKILERANKTVIGVIYKEKAGVYRLRPDRAQIYANIKITPENSMGAVIGDRAAAEITEYTDKGKVYGRVVSVLGSSENLKGCVDGLLMGSGIRHEFSDEVLRDAANVPIKLDETDIAGRRDLRNELIFTIDGDDARDFDDAVSAKILENGNCLLGVHIADVSHYVKPGTALDNEAYERGTSVYLADRVIPMLPERLSNGICSLNPNEDRLTLSVFMEIDKSGNTVKHSIEKSVICSKERMTYRNVTAILNGESEALRSRYGNILDTLYLMRDLAELLRLKREKRGAIQFDFPETEIVVDENGRPIDISKAERGLSNGIIEEFMLCANETVAEYAFWSDLPFVYRVHEPPSADKILVFNDFIKNFGLSVKGGKDGEIHPKALQQILDAVKDTPEERMVASNMLHSLMKAEYKPENLGHFGLASKYYCHFTSPIRRYPDLTVHRILKSVIDGKIPNGDKIGKIASHSSETEIAAQYLERDVDDLMKAAYMSERIGEAFDGIVANTAGFGMFVELANSVEGLVRVESMKDDYYELDAQTGALTGQRTNTVYRIGDEVRVVAVHADVTARQIDFVLEKDVSGADFRKAAQQRKKHEKIIDGKKHKKKRKFVKKKR